MPYPSRYYFCGKMFDECLVITIATLVNNSFHSGVFPASLKYALVTPLLKMPSLSPESLLNYRPVSQFSFISKLLERVVAIQLSNYLTIKSLYTSVQSAYRLYQSTETALLCISNDLLSALDRMEAVTLVLLDQSAALDTIDPKNSPYSSLL